MYITRVPGGWLMGSQLGQKTFVPFDNEFQRKTNES